MDERRNHPNLSTAFMVQHSQSYGQNREDKRWPVNVLFWAKGAWAELNLQAPI